ncbi:MAG TPA: DUF4386 domain-containing protein [Candidatus Acidoferrales bacterium]|nr:DUF4386 domain-containing protein [Candidatus Acidoferrales bacterium]
MTRTTNARVAGFMFLFYIVVGLTHLYLSNQATSGAEGSAAKLASMAQHATLVRLTVVLALLEAVSAVVLAVALYGLTRDVDHDLAIMALSFRVGEGVTNAISTVKTLAMLSIATAAAGAATPDAVAQAVGGVLLKVGVGGSGAFLFSVGSTIYSYLFLRARSIPVWLAWLGVFASILLVLLQPAQLAGFLKGPVTTFMWMPMLVFEVTLAVWLLIKGVATPATR